MLPVPAHAAHCFQSSALRALPLTPMHLFPATVCAHRPLMRFRAYETAPQRVQTAKGLGFVLSLVPLSGSSRAGFKSGRFSFGHEWAGGGGKSLSFTGVLGQSNEQESQTYRNRFGKTCLFSSDIGPHRPYWATRPAHGFSCPFYDDEHPIQPSLMLIQPSRQVLTRSEKWNRPTAAREFTAA